MAYVLTLVAVLVAFLWATPAHVKIAENIRAGARIAETSFSGDRAPITAYVRDLAAKVRAKAMELLRQELHRTVDGLVR